MVQRWWLAAFCVLLLLISFPALAAAQPASPATEAQAALDQARARLDDTRKDLQQSPITDAELLQARGVVEQLRQDAEKLAEGLQPVVTDLNAKLSQLGTPPEGETEPPDVAAQRADLQKSLSEAESRIKLARLLAVEASQIGSEILGARRAGFQARLGERTSSVFMPAFWAEVRADTPSDLQALRLLGDQLRVAVAAIPAPGWLLFTLAVVMVVLLRLAASRWLWRLTASRVPAGRLRRSVYAVAVLGLAVATPVAILVLGQKVVDQYAAMPDDMATLLAGLIRTLAFGGYVVGLGQALLAVDRPTWRLPTLPDLLALRLRWFPWLLAAVLVFAWLGDRLGGFIGVSFATTVAFNALVALLFGGVLLAALMRGEGVRRLALRAPDEVAMPVRPWWISLMVAGAWAVAIASLTCVLVGYVALGNFLLKQMAWTLVVLCSAYLFAVLIEDICVAVPEVMEARDEIRQPMPGRDQAAVLLAGVGRVAIVLIAGALLLAPFGEDSTQMLARIGEMQQVLQIGAVHIRPASVLQAVLVFAGVLLVVGVLKRWLAGRYLPAAGMDRDMSGSAATLVGYAGFVFAVALALVALGIGLERVAWIASALSVGIGFGLQAVVQNFVSGLILLAERPVKVGDWVSIDGMEGDIRRINARATEIQMGDRSTLIVPNSAFITKNVRNVTHTDPLGLVSFKLPLPLTVDATRVRDLLLGILENHESILDTPAPAVYLDGLDGRNLIFNATGYVGSPRMAYSVKSALLFDIIEALRKAEIPLQMLEQEDQVVAR